MRSNSRGRGVWLQPNDFKSWLISFTMVSAVMAVALPAMAAQQYQYDPPTCHDCHGQSTRDAGTPPNDIRPYDSATGFRNLTTGGFKGNHRTHMAATLDANVCAKCHNGTGNFLPNNTGHMNDFVNMTSNINKSPTGTATYSRGRFFNWTSYPTLGTCSNVNCHFEAATPQWGTAAFTYTDNTTNDCNKCHGAPPSGTSSPYAGGVAGSHAKHNSYYTGAVQCKKCHADHVSEGAAKFAHATSAGNAGRVISVRLNDPSDAASGSYNGAGTNFLPTQSGSQVFGTCSNTYCHSDGKGNYSAPVWNTAGTGACGTCHGAKDSATPSAPHGKHVGTAAGYLFACSKCHVRTVKSTVNSTTFAAISSYNLHVNKSIEVNFDSINPSGTYGGGACSNTYCHSNANPYLGTNTSVGQAWSGTLDCGGCHNKAGDTISAPKAWSAPHTKHINTYAANANMTCNACHANTASNNGTISNKSNHVNNSKDIAWNAFANNAAPAYNIAAHQCQNVYCHGDGTSATPSTALITWSGTLTCNSCHGGSAATPPTSTPHAKHVGNSSPYRYSCAKCHNATTTNGTSISDYSKHVNKIKDVVFANTSGTWSSPNCSNVYCHSIGNLNVNSVNLPGLYGGSLYASPSWSGTFACSGCHGRTTANGMPDYANAGAPGSATSNSHDKHVSSSAISCGECHTLTTKDGTTIRTTYPSYHVNRSLNDVYFNLSGNSKNGTYNKGSKTCSATYCHGTGPSIAWGSSTSCSSCHSANNTSFWNRSSAHKLHWEDATILPTKFTNTTTGNVGTNATYRFACGSCHRPGAGYATHANGPGNAKGDAQVFFGYTSSGKNPTYTYGTTTSTSDNGFKWSNGSASCSNTYCHSDGAGGSGSAVNWATIANSATDTRCRTCHRYTAASFSPMSTQRHYAHVGRYTFGCQECHYATTTTGNSITAKTQHVNKSKDVAWGTLNSGGASYVNASTTCANIYCHSRGTTTTAPFTTPINNTFKWNTAGNLGCTGCHGDSSTTGGNALSGAHQKHVNPTANATLGLGNGLGCVQCHAKTVSGNSTISNRSMHVNTLIDYSGVRAGTNKSCANFYCHSNGNASALVYVNPPAWGSGSTLGCNGCHGTGSDFNATNNGAPNYVNGGNGTATANSHKKHVSEYGINDTTGCSRCHVKTVNSSVASQFKDYTAASYHLNGNADVLFMQINSKTGTWNGSTCSNTYCHGTSASPAWGAASLACNVCHSANNALPGAHLIHYSSAALPNRFATFSGNVSTAASYRFSCGSCHSAAKGAAHANGPANANGVAQVFFGFTSSTLKGSYTYGTTAGNDNGFTWTNGGTGCNTSYCHSGGSAVSWTTTNSSTTPAVRCAKCHAYTAINTFGHNKHVVAYGYSCSKCHNATTTNGTTITDKRKHVNKTKDVVWDTAVDGGTVYSSLSCSGIYCHSQGTTFGGTYTGANIAPGTAATWNGSMPADCTGCHTGGTASGPTYANSTVINGWTKKNSHAKHVVTWGYTCNQCHNDVTTTGTSITSPANHVNKAYNLQAGGGVTFTPTIGAPGSSTSSCSNISCHGGNSATWGATLNCQDCHTGAGADVDAFTTPFSKTSPVAIINTTEWTTKGHGASSNYASGNVGANFGVETKYCEFCHDSAINHNDTINIFRLKNYSTSDWGRNGPCMACHGTGSAGVLVGITTKNGSKKVSAYHYGALHGATNSGGQFCWDCHDAHGDANDFMVHKQVARVSDRVTGNLTTTVATTFTVSNPPVWSDYVKPGAAYDGICQVCHTSGTSVAHFKSNQYDTNHNPGTRCTYCHSHSNTDKTAAFKPSTNCDLCHGYPPVRRGLTAGTVFKQNNYTSAQYQDYSGGGGAHTIGKHVPSTAKASDGWAPCAVCHSNGDLNPSMTLHTMQTPVKPSKITIDVKDRRKADSRRSLGPERYSGKLTDNHDNATGSCSNVNCHFKPSYPWATEK